MVEVHRLAEIRHAMRQPRRVAKYILIWCEEGSAELLIDNRHFTLRAGEVITITSGQVHCIEDAQNATGQVLVFTLDFFCKDDKDIELIFQNGLFCHFDQNEIIPVANPSLIGGQLEQIGEELSNQPYQFLTSIHARIELILVEINRSKVARGDEIWKPDALLLKFLELVRANFEHNYPLAWFAEELNTTEAKLNEQAKLHAGKTAQAVIHGLVASEAKRLLTYENLTVKEVAFRLGFRDPFYFSNFFKKYTNTSPRNYQQEHVR